MKTDKKTREAATRAHAYAAVAKLDAPGVATLSGVAKTLAQQEDVSEATARKWLREAEQQGHIDLLVPDRLWRVDIPRSDRWLRVAQATNHYELHVDGARPSAYGPGSLVLLSTPERTEAILAAVVAAEEAKAAEDKRQREERKQEEREEVNRRHPGLRRVLHKLNRLAAPLEIKGSGRMGGMHANVHIRDRDDQPLADQDVTVNLLAWGALDVATIQSILTAGVEAHIRTMDREECTGCARPIVHTGGEERGLWWHIDTGNNKCADGETRAEPATQK